MAKHNVLILSAGRRVELVQQFKKAAKKYNSDNKVYAADCSELAPALYIADDYFIIPKIHHEDYISELIKIIKSNAIHLIVPTIDTELPVLSKYQKMIEQKTKAIVMISPSETIEICNDKISTQEFLEHKGFHVPKLFKNMSHINNNNFPMFIKPKSGSSSKHTYKIINKADLDFYFQKINNPMIQEFVEGTEFTIDVFTDFQGNPITIVPRKRLEVRNGEISKGKIIKDQDIIKHIKKLVDVMKFKGHITIQLIKTKQQLIFIEINPRFGGGAPMSIYSGANSCEYLYKLLNGEHLTYHENYVDNLIFLRYDQAVSINQYWSSKND